MNGNENRGRVASPQPAPVAEHRTPLENLPSEAMRQVFSHLSVQDTMALAQASRTMHAHVAATSVVPHLQGVREVVSATQSSQFWTTQHASEPKRYFTQMSGAGPKAQMPHISEQQGHLRHLTDVAAVTYAKDARGGLGKGPHPSTIQFQETVPVVPGPNYNLGGPDIPNDADSSRVYTPVRNAQTLGMSANAHVNPRYRARFEAGNPQKSAPVQIITPAQSAQTPAQVSGKWSDSAVRGRDKP